MLIENTNDRFGIVIDAGSSGSRIHVFKWQDTEPLLHTEYQDSESTLQSVPHIHQENDWTTKMNPGLSTFEKQPQEAYKSHIKPLLDFAKNIIPESHWSSSPVFIQATAGMRLLPQDKQAAILDGLCQGLKHPSEFLIEDCSSQIQVIDGEIEGLYGWLGLNYLYGHFNNYDPQVFNHFTFGFMDMGGASTQIAFAPHDRDQIAEHRNDIATIFLKSVNGDLQKWDVFVSTWLGFGANQARRRYLAQLINTLPENTNDYEDDDFSTRTLNDPCMPRGSNGDFEFKDTTFRIIGSGNYEQCTKSIYPLLLKNMPCDDEPCLFNGVHAPRIDFANDKFIGTSEYWYTANDVFKLGGEYSFDKFSKSVREFCNANWTQIMGNSKKGMYNDIPDNFLKDACFKGNWVLNILHEGFDLPRIDVDAENVDDKPLFQSVEKVNERELSWTLGRILLYASGSVLAGQKNAVVGIVPSERRIKLTGIEFIHGRILKSGQLLRQSSSLSTKGFFMWFIIICCLFYLIFNKSHTIKRRLSGLYNLIKDVKTGIKRKMKSLKRSDQFSRLEEGKFGTETDNFKEAYRLKSNSMFDLGKSSATMQREHEPQRTTSQSANLAPSNLRPAFSMADFSKFKDSRLYD
ncbi:Ynd1p [Saccharomyces cerevisiae x Saccharomyces kudriavzevii VIN7]|uniref:Ynd1p n=1 Tax=Saccharomyces cerevisiae x Saccharomyces kudriavzevii (strain VIN7) TaxID=1095631 RepID=H0GTR1_SACCK|nr:Ynd1p [Saccharomyces cerevisiae x Saccharomyces kudriavzevii VIN7]